MNYENVELLAKVRNLSFDRLRVNGLMLKLFSFSVRGELVEPQKNTFARGIGKAIGSAFVREGAKVCLVDVDKGILETAKNEIRKSREEIIASIPLGRLGKPEDVAKAVLFLASDDASFITGEILDVNGGALMD